MRAAELTALIRDARGRRRDDRVGGEIGEVGTRTRRSRNSGVPRRLSPRTRTARSRRAHGLSKVSVRPAPARRHPAPDGGVAEVKLDFDVLARARRGGPDVRAWPARFSTERQPSRTSCSIASRRSRPPRSTSRPASRTRSSSTRRSRPTLDGGDLDLVSPRTRRTSGRTARPTSSSSHQPEEGDRAVQAAAVGPGDQGRDPGGAAPGRSPTCSAQLRVNDTREMVSDT